MAEMHDANPEEARRQDNLLRRILEGFSMQELLDWMEMEMRDLIGIVIHGEFDVPDKQKRDLMKMPQYAELRREFLLDDDLRCLRLCAGTTTPQAEREAYERAMGREKQ